jgi:hypothetical protein
METFYIWKKLGEFNSKKENQLSSSRNMANEGQNKKDIDFFRQ